MFSSLFHIAICIFGSGNIDFQIQWVICDSNQQSSHFQDAAHGLHKVTDRIVAEGKEFKMVKQLPQGIFQMTGILEVNGESIYNIEIIVESEK